MNAGLEVHFTVSGAATIAAVGNGDGKAPESYAGNTIHLFQGRVLVVLRTTRKAGPIKLTASGDGLIVSSLVVESKKTDPVPELR